MKRILLSFFVIIFITISAWILQRSLLEDPLPATYPEETAAHMLKNIDLAQGENGALIWRLNAASGNMRQKDGLIFVNEPDILYFTQPDNKEVHITARKGEVQQAEDRVRLWNEVVATYEGNRLEAAQMIYTTKSKHAVFDQAAMRSSENMHASANLLEWDMERNIITASDNVRVTFDQLR